MPKKKGAGKKGKGKAKKDPVEIEIREPPEDAVKRLMKAYDRLSKEVNRRVCTDLRRAMRNHIDEEQLLTRMILHPVAVKVPKKLPEDFVMPDEVNLEIFLKALNESCYVYFKDLVCWDINLDFVEFAKLCIMIEKQRRYRYLRMIELWNCSLNAKCAVRFSECLPVSNLTHLTFDDNEIEDEGCLALCRALKENKLMKMLSLSFCGLSAESGPSLGTALATTNIMDVYLDGNDLGCEGFAALIEPFAIQADEDAFYRQAEKERKIAEQLAIQEAKLAEEQLLKDDFGHFMESYFRKSGLSPTPSVGNPEEIVADDPRDSKGSKGKKGNKKKGKKGKRKGKGPALPAVPGPFLSKLHIGDNAIDMTSATGSVDLFTVASLLSRWLRGTDTLSELDLNYNEIGNSAANVIKDALEFRKEEKMPKLKLDVTSRIDKDIFGAIHKIAGGGATKRGRKGSGKGKKKGKKKK